MEFSKFLVALRDMPARRLPRSHEVGKRALDILGSTVLVIVLAPLFAFVAILVALGSPGGPLFRQRRLGRAGKPFSVLKFRSMRADAEQVLKSSPGLYETYLSGHFKIPTDADPRVTKAGAFLRRTSLDELPQLFNVLKGEMSLVGPRPIVPEETAYYNGHTHELLQVRPGITGLWQVSGRCNCVGQKRVSLDLLYVRKRSLWLDASILFATLVVVLRAEGTG